MNKVKEAALMAGVAVTVTALIIGSLTSVLAIGSVISRIVLWSPQFFTFVKVSFALAAVGVLVGWNVVRFWRLIRYQFRNKQ